MTQYGVLFEVKGSDKDEVEVAGTSKKEGRAESDFVETGLVLQFRALFAQSDFLLLVS